MDRRLPLFVFGTLRRGESNHDRLKGRYDRVLPAILNDYERIDPLMIDAKPGGVVDGELFFLTTALYDVIMADCDELEELPPGEMRGEWYERRTVIVTTNEGSFEAWAYVRPSVARQ
ncbi:gamma-glutamylcyclotransferase family protein [Stratiformator vulcanicus]|uniref:AIG2-like family protein n=1 Tax=Stratiformator vulcanicus TaxID=2527980 RepID=A0A517R0E6_9PLAN|nr:gamma-glutamylcyclotransferase family protein [Stratiformator vulcanicus]QDT37303.1 AIG2-like family protein [Stratiformator vulcanicus]